MFSQFRQAAHESSLDEDTNTVRTSADMMPSLKDTIAPSRVLRSQLSHAGREVQSAREHEDGEGRNSGVESVPAARASHRDPLARINALRGNIARSSSSGAALQRRIATSEPEASTVMPRSLASTSRFQPPQMEEQPTEYQQRVPRDAPTYIAAPTAVQADDSEMLTQRRSASYTRSVIPRRQAAMQESQAQQERPSTSMARPVVNFEDLPAAVSTRQEVGVVNDFHVPETSGVIDAGTAEMGGTSDRPKPKMLKRGDGTRKLNEKMEKHLMEAAIAKASPALAGEKPSRHSSEEPAQRQPSVAVVATRPLESNPKKASVPAPTPSVRSNPTRSTQPRAAPSFTSTVPTIDLAASIDKPPKKVSRLVPLPTELLSIVQAAPSGGNKTNARAKQTSVAAATSNADAIKAHLMSVFGAGLDTTIGGSHTDAEAAAIVDTDIANFPKYLLAAMKDKRATSSDIAAFLNRRDQKVLGYLDIRRMDFLSNMFPDHSFNDTHDDPVIARFAGPDGFANSTVLKPHQYHTLVRQFDDMEE